MKRPMSCGGGSTPFDDSQKFARFSRIISKDRYTLNKKFSWAEETGDFSWHCESCHACFELYPLSDEAKAVYNVKEIAIHKGKQESSIGQPHYCEDCGVVWKIDFTKPKEVSVLKEDERFKFGSCSSVDAEGRGAA